MGKKKEFSQEDILNIIDLYQNQNMPMKKIGKQYNCSVSPIKRILQENNIQIKQKKVYQIGELVGPYNHKIIDLVRENGRLYGIFECGWCHSKDTHFKLRIDNVKHGDRISCGCQTQRIRQAAGERLRKHQKEHAGEPRPNSQKIHPGDIIGPKNNILFLEEIEPKIYNGFIKRAGKFKNLDTQKEFESTITNVQQGWCSGNSISEGEALIEKLLIENNIEYETQKTFPNLKGLGKGLLRFDFYLPEYNCCIEYDGVGHYYYNEKSEWRTQENVEKTKIHDELKNQYCKNNNIKLIRIPYTDYKNITINYITKKLVA